MALDPSSYLTLSYGSAPSEIPSSLKLGHLVNLSLPIKGAFYLLFLIVNLVRDICLVSAPPLLSLFHFGMTLCPHLLIMTHSSHHGSSHSLSHFPLLCHCKRAIQSVFLVFIRDLRNK